MFISNTDDNYVIEIPSAFNGYQIINEIGKGSFSVIAIVEKEITREYFAAKIISKANMIDKEMSHYVSREIEIFSSLNHSNIVKFYESFEITNYKNEEFIIIIEEYCMNGSLLNLANNYTLNQNDVKVLGRGILDAIDYLHANGIAHCDIKPENILLDDNFVPKLSDFGMSIDCNKKKYEKTGGSFNFAAPELLNDLYADRIKSDIWAFGILMFVIYEKCFPHNCGDDVLIGRLSIETNNKELKNFVGKCTRIDPNERPTANELINDEYFSFSPEYTNDFEIFT